MPQIGDLLKNLSPDDVRVDQEGRVVITSPGLVEELKKAGAVGKAGTLSGEDLARADTNIICCGNSKCGRATDDLGSIVERFTQGRTPG